MILKFCTLSIIVAHLSCSCALIWLYNLADSQFWLVFRHCNALYDREWGNYRGSCIPLLAHFLILKFFPLRFFFLDFFKIVVSLSHKSDLIVETRIDHAFVLIKCTRQHHTAVNLGIFLNFFVFMVEIKIDWGLISTIFLLPNCIRSQLLFWCLQKLRLSWFGQDFDWKVDWAALTPLVPSIVLYKHSQHVPNLENLTKKARAETLKHAYALLVDTWLKTLLEVRVIGSIVILLRNLQL